MVLQSFCFVFTVIDSHSYSLIPHTQLPSAVEKCYHVPLWAQASKLSNVRPSNESFTLKYEWIKNKHQGNPKVREMPEGSQNCIRLITVPIHQTLHFWEVQNDLHPLLWDMDPAPVRYLHRKIMEQRPQ